MTLDELNPGAVFITTDGVLAVKSEYKYSSKSDAQWQCVLLASGEYAHFPNRNRTEIREIHITDLLAALEDSLGIILATQSAMLEYGAGPSTNDILELLAEIIDDARAALAGARGAEGAR